jgi:hypothetical protein
MWNKVRGRSVAVVGISRTSFPSLTWTDRLPASPNLVRDPKFRRRTTNKCRGVANAPQAFRPRFLGPRTRARPSSMPHIHFFFLNVRVALLLFLWSQSVVSIVLCSVWMLPMLSSSSSVQFAWPYLGRSQLHSRTGQPKEPPGYPFERTIILRIDGQTSCDFYRPRKVQAIWRRLLESRPGLFGPKNIPWWPHWCASIHQLSFTFTCYDDFAHFHIH